MIPHPIHEEVNIASLPGGKTVITIEPKRIDTHQYALLLSVAAIPRKGGQELLAATNLPSVYPVEEMLANSEVADQVLGLVVKEQLTHLLQNVALVLKVSPEQIADLIYANICDGQVGEGSFRGEADDESGEIKLRE